VTTPGSEPTSAIEHYLDEIVAESSPRRPRELRHLLAEAEAHLWDVAEREVRSGRSQAEAESFAVASFGAAHDLVVADARRASTPLGLVVRQIVFSALLLAGTAGVAVGVSGAIAEGVRLVGGTAVLVDAPGQGVSASDCARWMAADLSATNCRDAAMADWVAETVAYRLAAGTVGGLGLLVYAWSRRRGMRRGRWAVLPAEVTDTIAVLAFGAAGAWTLAMGLHAVFVSSGHGSGQWLSAAPVALAAAGVFGWRLLEDLRTTPM
jgi:hypothetical protein